MGKDKLWSSTRVNILLIIIPIIRTFTKKYKSAIPTLFADDISIFIADPNVMGFRSKLFSIFNTTGKWLTVNSLSLNLNKIYYTQFGGIKIGKE
jgi:hypothetical protein